MWLLEASIRQRLEEATAAGVSPTAEQQAGFDAVHGEISAQSSSRVLAIAGDTAQISVKGVLTKEPSWMSMLFGGGNTTYSEIVNALAEAEANPAVSKAVLAVDSPGGSVAGLFDALAAIESFKKPIESVVSDVAASAAFAIVSATDKITATNPATSFGSIGIVASVRVDENKVTIASTAAPKKSPDVTTESGIADVREELDALHEIFVEAIAKGRGVTPKEVNADFGQGGTFLAGEALKRGMIDAVAGATPALSVVANAHFKPSARDGGDNSEKRAMDLETLKAQHPDVYAAVKQKGVTHERDRVSAHLIMGEASGDMKTAVLAITEGTEMTAAVNAKYVAAGINRASIAARGDDDMDAGALVSGVEADADAQATANEATLKQAAELCGVTLGA